MFRIVFLVGHYRKCGYQRQTDQLWTSVHWTAWCYNEMLHRNSRQCWEYPKGGYTYYVTINESFICVYIVPYVNKKMRNSSGRKTTSNRCNKELCVLYRCSISLLLSTLSLHILKHFILNVWRNHTKFKKLSINSFACSLMQKYIWHVH